ncbi:hypothetical protein niasHS_016736 [Heterodera schachtii]|uniref:Uncharacterized protein n=1 Tax=Heterodera schachtii TaxID=97005 RepID=A0ABD2HUD6_HETSC
MASLNTTALSETELFLLFLGGAVELITTLVGIPLSIANLILVARTSVIHPNMKAILIFQSFFILLRGSCRLVICLFKFITWDLIGAKYMQFFPALRKMYFIGIYARNFVPHVLIVERIFATLFVRTYEKNRCHLFTILWTPFALIIPIYIAFSTSPQIGQNQPITNLITTAVELVIGSIELGIFHQLCRYNSKLYQKMFQTIGSNNLSIRYQLSENIRIGKQLIPPLSLNLGNIFAGTIILLWDLLNWPYNELIANFCINLNSFFGLLIELFIITCHPFLKRDLCQFLNRIGTMFGFNHLANNHRIGDATAAPSLSAVNGIAQRNLISGKAMINTRSKPEEHFAVLKEAWEKGPMKRQNANSRK